MKKIGMALLLVCVVGCRRLETATGKPCAQVEQRVRDYFIAKYPTFAELVALRTKPALAMAGNKADALYRVCPVSEIMNSYAPRGLYLAFVETTEVSPSTVHVLTLDLYAEKDGTCRVGVRVDERRRLAGEPAARGMPVSATEIRELLTRDSGH
jgi:hypothetical protein